ncbi:hypothetical protein HPP92_000952 [Vanilla planifolia]|uniref:DEAD-box helicase OB fold domain-containing protein n=1 Tax=Vanilla planifolia TaxID=51239 RepID=A0A835RXA1_VANPL|nr:hypothetical protein HPP92_000952 [Vanilla planifolia]
MVGRLLPRQKQNSRTTVETCSGSKVCLHPHSSNFNLSFGKSAGNPIIGYDEITRGDGGLYIRNSSIVSPYPLLLLAVEMAVTPAINNCDDNEEGSEASSDEDDEMNMNTSEQHENNIMSSPDNAVTIVIDRWLKFQSTALDVAQIYCLRERLATAMMFKVKNPRSVLPPHLVPPCMLFHASFLTTGFPQFCRWIKPCIPRNLILKLLKRTDQYRVERLV